MKKSVKSQLFMILILTIMLVLTGFFGYVRYQNKNKENDNNNIIDDDDNDKPKGCELVDNDNIYLAIGETRELKYDVVINDSNIQVNNNTITGLGNTKYTVELSKCKYLNIYVSDMYTKEILDNNKEYLPDGIYSKEDNEFLDEVLKYLINEAGYRTRAGAVEAVRFLALRFKYNIQYFYENGRLVPRDEFALCDSEGRFYHEGLYLNEYKYPLVTVTYGGPGYWGKPIPEDVHGDSLTPNGLDCSGYLSWALFNAGYDCGDIGAGPNDKFDFTDMGEFHYIDSVDVDRLRVGDIVGFIGHVAMIIGMDDDHIYIAQEYWEGDLSVMTQTYREFIEDSEWEYVMYMDDYYEADGNLTNMWD